MFRFRIWQDGIHYLEITATRGYDHGVVKLVAENDYGREMATAKIEIYQGEDFRSVLHKGDGKSQVKNASDVNALKQYRIARNIEKKQKGFLNIYIFIYRCSV